MASPNPLKRPSDLDFDSRPSKQHKLQNHQECACCTEFKASSQFKKFSICKSKPCNRVCNACWTQEIKTNIIDNPQASIKCFECNTVFDEDQVEKLLYDKQILSFKDREHYYYRLRSLHALERGERECSRSGCQSIQSHHPAKDRIFTCQWCGAADCIACDKPEHHGETCAEYQSRLTSQHGHEEQRTQSAFANGYMGVEKIGKKGNRGWKSKLPVPCPGCGIRIERSDKCTHMRCLKCCMDFCCRPGCGATYLGKGSVPELGNAAHVTTCAYYRRTKEDRRLVKRKSPMKSCRKEGYVEDVGDDD